MGVSENGGTPKSSILIGISIVNHPFWGTPILETPISIAMLVYVLLLEGILYGYVVMIRGTRSGSQSSHKLYLYANSAATHV